MEATLYDLLVGDDLVVVTLQWAQVRPLTVRERLLVVLSLPVIEELGLTNEGA